MIKAITFDLWNTLISDKDYGDQRVKCLVDSLRELGVSRSYVEVKEAYTASQTYALQVWKDENHRCVKADERLNYILKKLSVDLTDISKRQLLKASEELVLTDPPMLFAHVRETLRFLSTKYKMGIISDSGMTPGRVLRKVLAGHQILDLFDITIFSDEVGYNKPHRIIFEITLKSLGVKPSEAVHIGDLLHTDIAGAKNVGMKTIWVNNKRDVITGSFKPDYEIQTFQELLNVLNCIC